MRKLFLATTVATLLAFPAGALATGNPNPQDPCEHNPTTLCDLGITIDQPTAEECPTGGIVLVIGDDRFPVCNGAAGANGTNGANGTVGATGAAGLAGALGAAGVTGATGTTGAAGATGAAGVTSAPKSCISRRTISVKLPGRFKVGQKVQVLVGGTKFSAKVNKAGRVKVSLVGRKCGVYGIAFRRHGVLPFKRLYVTGPAGNVTAYNVPLPRR